MADVKLWRFIQTSALTNELIQRNMLYYERTDTPKTNKYLEVTRADNDIGRKKSKFDEKWQLELIQHRKSM